MADFLRASAVHGAVLVVRRDAQGENESSPGSCKTGAERWSMV